MASGGLNPHNWYLVRANEPEIPTEPPEPPGPGPDRNTPGPPPAGPDPTPPQPGPPPTGPESGADDTGSVSLADALTNAANAAIGTFSAVLQMFYADLGTLNERLGELRLQSLPPPTPPSPSYTKEGKAIAPPPPPPGPLGLDFWIRGFGSGYHINNQASRAFDQNLGGFQVGADRHFITSCGDLYLGGFLGYFYASRDFLNNSGDGYSNAFSVGAYTSLIHPSGFYADLVIKNTWFWNHFSVPTSGEVNPTAIADYSNEAFGGSIEIGKRWDFGKFFLEPQAQLAGAWADSQSYNVSNGLTVNGSDQGSLRGRLGARAGLHLESGRMAFEPFAGVFVINEFLGGDKITTD